MEDIKPMFTPQEFYDYFNSIPEELWTQDELTHRLSKGKYCHCALYFLGCRNTRGRKNELILPDEDSYPANYGYINQIARENVIRLSEILNGDWLNPNDYTAQGNVLHVNDTLKTANKVLGVPKDFNLLDLNRKQKAKLAKQNILNALKEVMSWTQ